jgi:glycosyltransferase involved in cell wall biosynthesis
MPNPLSFARSCRKSAGDADLVWKFYPETMRFFGRYLDQILMPRSILRADLILSVSFNTAHDICKLFPDAKFKVTTIHLGSGLVDSHAPTPLIFDKPNINAFFLFVGTLEPRKNLYRLLKAYALLDANDKKAAHFVIVGGDGWGNINLEGLISDLHIKDYVHILGYVSQSELESLYAHSLFLAMPSLYEGFGLPITEAMKYGTPILCSNVSSLPEIAGNAAILVNPFDINSIHSGLVKLINNPIFREELSRIALVQSTFFSWDKASQMTLYAINRVALL